MKIEVKQINDLKEGKGSTVAFATVQMSDGEDSLIVPGFPIIKRKDGKGIFSTIPQTKGKDGKFHPVVYVTKALKDKALGTVLAEYKKPRQQEPVAVKK